MTLPQDREQQPVSPGQAAAMAACIRRDLSALAGAAGPEATADHHAALAALARIESRLALCTPDLPVLDPAPLRRLMVLAGEDDRAELLRRLDQDLAAAALRLQSALTDPRLPDIRAATHVLVSLAGSVGGRATETLARALNSAVHDGAPPDLLTGRITALVAAVAALRAALPGQAGAGIGDGGT